MLFKGIEKSYQIVMLGMLICANAVLIKEFFKTLMED